MIRKHLIDAGAPGEADFRWRGEEVTRLEGFSDAVFAFAVTLLVVSLEVPKSFPEFMEVLRGFLPFAACFYLLAIVWWQHMIYFRRYGLQDNLAVTLNCMLLFCVLFYVYPMKFLFVKVFEHTRMEEAEVRTMFLVFGLGFGAISVIFALLQWHAWQRRDALGLNLVECLKTKQALFHQQAMVLVGLAGVCMAEFVPTAWVGLTGMFYFVIPLYYLVCNKIFNEQRRRIAQQSAAETAS
jgi:uncharacterized membrane protein